MYDNPRINAVKSQAILFSSQKKHIFLKSVLKIVINNNSISFVTRTKNLRAYIDENLLFTPYYVMVKLLYGNRQFLSYKMKKSLPESLILSKLNYYYYFILSMHTKVDSNIIQKIQNTGCM